MARHNLQKNPEDFEAHYNLAALLMGPAKAPRLSRILRRPPHPPQRANGEQRLRRRVAGGRPHRGVHFALTAALNARPDYFDARYNLGNALASLGDFRGALAQFQVAVRINPKTPTRKPTWAAPSPKSRHQASALHYQRALQRYPC